MNQHLFNFSFFHQLQFEPIKKTIAATRSVVALKDLYRTSFVLFCTLKSVYRKNNTRITCYAPHIAVHTTLNFISKSGFTSSADSAEERNEAHLAHVHAHFRGFYIHTHFTSKHIQTFTYT